MISLNFFFKNLDGDMSNILQAVDVPVYSNEDCISKSNYTSDQITDKMVCAGYLEGGKDACQVVLPE